MHKTFSIISLGCPRNLVDSEYIIAEFKNKGYVFQEEVTGVDVVVINTCSFIEDAKKESVDTILKAIDAKKDGSVKKIIVAGCLPERYKNELKEELKEVDEFRGVLGFRDESVSLSPHKEKSRLYPGHYAYIKISEGCKNRCTYCIIPFLKGPYRSKGIDSIIKEAKFFIDSGVKEIVLVGQDTSLYGIDLYGKKTLPKLLRELENISRDNWIRLLYCHPANLSKEVIKIIGQSKNICKYIDLPVEHISDRILKGMRRKTKKRTIVSLIKYIRDVIPEVALRTSLIVGFPGETEKEFLELLDFIRKTRFERLGLFRYSREEGTPAYKYKGQVSEEEKERRFKEAMLLQQEISGDVNENFKGRTLKVLIDEKNEHGYIGRTEYDAPDVDGVCYVRNSGLKIGNFYNVRIIDTYEYDLVGEIR